MLENQLWYICQIPLTNQREPTTDTQDDTDESQEHDAKWKKPLTKNYFLNYPIYITFWKKTKKTKQNNRDQNTSVVVWSGAQKGEVTREEQEGIFRGGGTVLYPDRDHGLCDCSHLSKLIELYRLKGWILLNVNYPLRRLTCKIGR